MDGLAQPRRGSRQCGPSPWTDERIEYVKARWSRAPPRDRSLGNWAAASLKAQCLGKFIGSRLLNFPRMHGRAAGDDGPKTGVTPSTGRLNAPSAGFVQANNGGVRSG